MADLFFSFDGQNYARYLTYFSVFLANVEETHPGATELVRLGAISVARSFVPGNQCDVDKTIEETFMKHAKSHAGAGGRGAGVSGILNNYEAYRRWAKIAHERSRYLDVTLQMADMTDEDGKGQKHRDVRPSQIRKSEAATVKVIDAINSSMNPFDVESHQLFRIASGAPAPPGICEDIMDAETKGKHAKDSFITERLKKDKDFFEPIKRLKLKTFADMSKKVTVKTSSNREIEYRQQGNVAFQLLVLSQNQTEKLDMKELLRYPLMPVPSSIGTPDGFLLKTDKSKAFSHLTKGITDAVPPPGHATLNIEDGNATFYCMTDVPTSFKQIGEKLLDMSTGGKSKVVFSTDMYKDDSIKSMERRSRGCGEKRIIQSENTRRPENWKEFLSNDDNKQQLIALLLKIWSSPECSRKLQKKEVIAICEGKAYLLTSDGKTVEKSEILTLESDQEETDTRVVLYCSFAEQEKDQRLLDVTGMSKDFTPMYCSALLGLHAFTRCDTTSAFKGIGKVKPLKLLQQKPRYQEVFQSLGTTWRIPNELYQGLEEFTCNMYKRTTKSSAVNELRYEMIASKCGGQTGLEIKLERKVDLSSLPPPRSCLNEHIRRVNYQVGIWKRAHIPKPIIPEATDDHGWVKRNCEIEPKWSAGDVIPPKLADVLEKMECDDDDEGQDDSETDSDDSEYEEAIPSSDSDYLYTYILHTTYLCT
ncbi:hypothetical protein GQR58_010026 [Nymphon striatum]|nr:hypothetical protein GQR58_010026 [Nymphon striatum]